MKTEVPVAAAAAGTFSFPLSDCLRDRWLYAKNYTPFLYTREVPSRGLATRIKGWKTGRVHHFLSILERNYFYTLEWSPLIVDVREQFPLPLESTLEIAERLSIKHPFDPKAKEHAIVTTDFVIDVQASAVFRENTDKVVLALQFEKSPFRTRLSRALPHHVPLH